MSPLPDGRCAAHDDLAVRVGRMEGVTERILATLEEIRSALARLEERIYDDHGDIASARAHQRASSRALTLAVAIGAAIGALSSAVIALARLL